MAGLVPAIHAILGSGGKLVNARAKAAGHDGIGARAADAGRDPQIPRPLCC
jgi:hypothetical protein